MDPVGFFKTRPQYMVVFGIVLLVIACICAYVELNKSGRPANATWIAISIISFVSGIILLLGTVLFSGYTKYCRTTVVEDNKYTPSSGLELQ